MAIDGDIELARARAQPVKTAKRRKIGENFSFHRRTEPSGQPFAGNYNQLSGIIRCADARVSLKSPAPSRVSDCVCVRARVMDNDKCRVNPSEISGFGFLEIYLFVIVAIARINRSQVAQFRAFAICARVAIVCAPRSHNKLEPILRSPIESPLPRCMVIASCAPFYGCYRVRLFV